MKRHSSWSRGPAALAAMAALAFGACGGANEAESTPPAKDTASTAASPEEERQLSFADPEAQVRAAFKGFLEDFHSGRADETCDHFTARAAAETVKNFGKAFGDCPTAMRAYMDAYGDSFTGKPRIVALKLKGRRAVLTLMSGDRIKVKAPYVKTADGWKLDEGHQAPATPLEPTGST